jgi:hypothetical protein
VACACALVCLHDGSLRPGHVARYFRVLTGAFGCLSGALGCLRVLWVLRVPLGAFRVPLGCFGAFSCFAPTSASWMSNSQ